MIFFFILYAAVNETGRKKLQRAPDVSSVPAGALSTSTAHHIVRHWGTVHGNALVGSTMAEYRHRLRTNKQCIGSNHAINLGEFPPSHSSTRGKEIVPRPAANTDRVELQPADHLVVH